jgi:hypothetical protein
MSQVMPSAGPFTARLAAKHGMDPQLFSRSILALFDPMPSAVEQQSARLAAIMANDVPGQIGPPAPAESFSRRGPWPSSGLTHPSMWQSPFDMAGYNDLLRDNSPVQGPPQGISDIRGYSRGYGF